MPKKLNPKDAEKLRRRNEARSKQSVHYVCERKDCPICRDLDD